MSKQETIISSVKNGKLSKQAKDVLVSQIMKCEGGRIMITCQKFSSKRSLPQNSYQHLLYTILRDGLNDFGNEFTMEDVKQLCKYKFLLIDVINEETGEVIGKRIKGTSELTKSETMDYLDAIIRWAQDDFNIKLPSSTQLTID